MSPFRKILFPFSIAYNGLTFLRNKLFDAGFLKAVSFDIPVIVVGNLSVGGTGKTPQIEYLVRLLQNNYKVAVLSRGYKRKTSGFLLANSKTTVSEIGDEPFQFFNKFKNIYVAVDEKRVRGVQSLQRLENPPEIILLDDAYQHRKVKAKANILLTPYNDLYVDDLVLPAGNLRESKRGANRASVIIVTKCPKELSDEEQNSIRKKLMLNNEQYLFFTTIEYAIEIKGASGHIPLKELQNYHVLLVTGIANPKPLVSFLENKNMEITHLEYGDHHNFSDEEIVEIKERYNNISVKNKVLLTTEKDYMRIKENLDISYIEIETSFLGNGDRFDELMNRYVE